MEGRGVLAALAGAMALAGLGTAGAAAQEGAVVIAWHGDPARCAPAGLCGASGSLVYAPRVVTSEGFGRPSELPTMVPRRGPLARAALQERQCADALAGDVLRLDSVPGTRLVPVDEGSAGGRCAGPTFDDVRDALPQAVEGASGVVDLRGRRAFSAGPLAGEVISSLVLRAQPGAVAARRARSVLAPRARVVEYALTYRIRRVSGAFGIDFRAADDPACRRLGACGAVGRVAHSMDLRGRRVVLSARRPLRGRRPPSLRQALRRGGARLAGTIRAPGAARTVAEVAQPGAATCRDTTVGAPPQLAVSLSRDRVRAAFEVDDEQLDALDPVRTRCPGPTRADVIGDAPLAMGDGVRRSARLRLRLPFRGRFAAPGYSGVRRGGIVLDLERTRIRTRVLRTGRS